jgi:hypothetical protein
MMAALYLIVFSIGEAFYSPRVYETPPRSHRGRKHRMAHWRTFHSSLAKLCRSRRMVAGCVYERSAALERCGLFALAASVAPIGLIALRRYIRVPEAGRPNWKMASTKMKAQPFLVGLRIGLKSRPT